MRGASTGGISGTGGQAKQDLAELQRKRLRSTIAWAREIRTTLGQLMEAHGERVHFRASAGGITMVGLLPERPQRGVRISNAAELAERFEAEFGQHCRDIAGGRITGENALRSYLIRTAHQHEQCLAPLNAATQLTNAPAELTFITDGLSLPLSGGKTEGDLLALRRDAGRCTPVLLQLKDNRHLNRLLPQVENFAPLIDQHAELFAELFGAVLEEDIAFDAPAEKWIVWPAVAFQPDRQTEKLRERGIRTVCYTETNGSYEFACADSVRWDDQFQPF